MPGGKPIRMHKEELIKQLETMVKALKEDDSFSGSISYDCMEEGLEPDEFMVMGVFRLGNRDGQGFMRVFQDFTMINKLQTAVVRAECVLIWCFEQTFVRWRRAKGMDDYITSMGASEDV